MDTGYTKEYIADRMEKSNRWLIRGLLAIYRGQTSDEVESRETSHVNGIGFNGYDANILTGFAEQVLEWQDTPEDDRRYPSPLSTKQLEITRSKMRKYAGQLARIAAVNAIKA